ncbi:MAG: Holliday junction resolvase RuvX [Lachnospiraceae bacterium]|nr:Holliday junction resolvase RuvX [Lachnospiraceae bacterium]
MRVLGLDYGEKTVGVALSDGLGLTAQAKETIVRKEENKLRSTYRRIEELIEEYEVGEIVVGLPLHLDGSAGERARLAEVFAENLRRRTGLPVIMQDERLTTVEADEILEESRVPKSRRKEVIDQIAAGFILQDYLDYKSREALPKERSEDGRTDCI